MSQDFSLISVAKYPGLVRTIESLQMRHSNDEALVKALRRLGWNLGMERPAKRIRIKGPGWQYREEPQPSFEGMYMRREGDELFVRSSHYGKGGERADNVYVCTEGHCTCEAGERRAQDMVQAAKQKEEGKVPSKTKVPWCIHRALLMVLAQYKADQALYRSMTTWTPAAVGA